MHDPSGSPFELRCPMSHTRGLRHLGELYGKSPYNSDIASASRPPTMGFACAPPHEAVCRCGRLTRRRCSPCTLMGRNSRCRQCKVRRYLDSRHSQSRRCSASSAQTRRNSRSFPCKRRRSVHSRLLAGHQCRSCRCTRPYGYNTRQRSSTLLAAPSRGVASLSLSLSAPPSWSSRRRGWSCSRPRSCSADSG